MAKTKPNGYWNNYDNCFNEAKKYTTLKDFRTNSPGAHGSSVRNGWINDFYWLKKTFRNITKPNGYWTRERCYEEALKYNKKSIFHKNARGAYSSALNNGWLCDYTWMDSFSDTDRSYWVYSYEDKDNKVVYVGLTFRRNRHKEHLRAKESDDVVKRYFGNNIPTPRILMSELTSEQARDIEDWYKNAYANDGWETLNIAKTGICSSSLGSTIVKWTYDACKEEASKYQTRNEFSKGCHSGYHRSCVNGWLDEWFDKKDCKPKGYWTYENCRLEAKKYNTIRQFKINSRGAYCKAFENGWLYDFFDKPTRKQKGYWTYEHCKEEAIKYDRRVDFCDNCHTAYAVSLDNGWVDEWFGDKWESLSSVKTKWDYESCKEEAKKHSTRSVFSKKANGAYDAARKNGWLDEFFPKKVA